MLELSHKKLLAWQKAINLLPLIYELCKKLPHEEIYNLISQMKFNLKQYRFTRKRSFRSL